MKALEVDTVLQMIMWDLLMYWYCLANGHAKGLEVHRYCVANGPMRAVDAYIGTVSQMLM